MQSPPLYLFWGAEDTNSAYRFLSTRIELGQPIDVGGNDFLDLKGRIERRGANFVADVVGSTGGQSQLFRGDLTIGKPFFAQAGAASGYAGPRYWFLLATNADCRKVLEQVNAVTGLAGPPFYRPAPWYETLPAANTTTNIDPVTGLPWGNRLVDPVTGLPLSPGQKKK